MFLYATLVLQNLHALSTQGELIDAVEEEIFPDGLSEA